MDASGYEMFSSASGIIRSETQANMVVPRSEAGDPFQMLLRQRIVMLGNQVDDFIADAIISQLLLLNQQDPTKEIKLFINSPGGSVTAGMGIYDAMQFVQAPVGTVCMGVGGEYGGVFVNRGREREEIVHAERENYDSSTVGWCEWSSGGYRDSSEGDDVS